MKHIGNEIKELIYNKKLKQKEFAEKIEMSTVNLSKIFKKASIDASLLEKIAKTLGVTVSHFFEEYEDKGKSTHIFHNNNGNGNQTNGTITNSVITQGNESSEMFNLILEGKETEILYLKQRLEDKEREIKLKDEIIEMWKKSK